jgi:hypothetical protein
VSYEYRVFMVQQAKEWTFLHLAAERLRDGVVVEVERPGSELDGLSVSSTPCSRTRSVEGQGSHTPGSRLDW